MIPEYILFPTGFRSISRLISSQAVDKAYAKKSKSESYIISRSVLRTEQREWSYDKFKKPTLDEAWELAITAKFEVDSFVAKMQGKKRQPTWNERWLMQEITHLRSLAIHWLTQEPDTTTKRVFHIGGFMSSGVSDIERETLFTCPDGSMPTVIVKCEFGEQASGNLWIDEDWESAPEQRVLRNPRVKNERSAMDLVQRMWRFIPEDVYLYCAKTPEIPCSITSAENLATEDEVIRQEERRLAIIANKQINKKPVIQAPDNSDQDT